MKKLLSLTAIITVLLTTAAFNPKRTGAFYFLSPIPIATCNTIAEGFLYIASPEPTHYVLETLNYPYVPGWQAFSFGTGEYSSLSQAIAFFNANGIQYRCENTFRYESWP